MLVIAEVRDKVNFLCEEMHDATNWGKSAFYLRKRYKFDAVLPSAKRARV